MEEALVAYLLANAGLAALVGTRINWNLRPQTGMLPAVALHVISAPALYTFAGRINLVGRLVQIDCWGGSYTQAKGVARAVASALDGLTTGIFHGALDLVERDMPPERADGPDASGAATFHRTSLDVRVWSTDP